MNSINLLILIVVGLARANPNENPVQQALNRPPASAPSVTSGFSLGKQYNIDAKLQQDGTTSGSVFAMLGGKVGPGEQYYLSPTLRDEVVPAPALPAYYPYDASASTDVASQSSTSLWSPTYINYCVAGGVFLIVLIGYGAYAIISKSSVFKSAFKDMTEDEDDEPLGKVSETKKETSKAKKSRRRRAIRRNEEAARLASIVLSAIESGECLQRSICLMGSQIGGSERGKLASNVLQKLIPPSIQETSYYLTLQKSLGGDAYCDKFNCKY